jgi:hypothetical protein
MMFFRTAAHIRKKETGVGLIEISVGLTLMALVSAGVLLYASGLRASTTTQNAASDVVSLKGRIEAAFANQASYANFLDGTLFNAGLTPSHLTNAALPHDSKMNSRFRNPIELGRASVGCVGCNNGFWIEYIDVPNEYCAKFIPLSIGINADIFSVGNTRATLVDYPASTSNTTVVSACNATADNFHIRWTFVR